MYIMGLSKSSADHKSIIMKLRDGKEFSVTHNEDNDTYTITILRKDGLFPEGAITVTKDEMLFIRHAIQFLEIEGYPSMLEGI